MRKVVLSLTRFLIPHNQHSLHVHMPDRIVCHQDMPCRNLLRNSLLLTYEPSHNNYWNVDSGTTRYCRKYTHILGNVRYVLLVLVTNNFRCTLKTELSTDAIINANFLIDFFKFFKFYVFFKFDPLVPKLIDLLYFRIYV